MSEIEESIELDLELSRILYFSQNVYRGRAESIDSVFCKNKGIQSVIEESINIDLG